MEKGLFAYIFRYSKRQQIFLTLITIVSFPFYYLSLDLPKTIINDAISSDRFPVDATVDVAGITLFFGSFEQIPFLLLLCFAFLLLVLINGGFKLFINIYRGVLGERMLRRLRLQLINRIMKFPLARFRRTSQGELVSMVNQETEPLGGFIGEAISLPLYQGGLLLTILVFMFVQDWKLGLAAISLYPVQAWIIPKLQRQVNLLNQRRTMRLRNLAENLGEVVAGINEVHINNNATFFSDHFSKLLGGIFNIRVQIYKKKFLIKFVNNSFAQLTPFLFFLIGGLLVIRGDLSIGALVAALAAYKDLSPPWKELLAWYQGQADARLKYQILTEQFQLEEDGQTATVSELAVAETKTEAFPIVASNVSLKRMDGTQELENVSLTIEQGDWISLVGTGTSGKNGLAQLCARLVHPSSGKILMAGRNAQHISAPEIAKAIAYAGHDSYLFSDSIRNNLLLSLKHTPQSRTLSDTEYDDSMQFKNWKEEARLSGNSDVELNADWIDYESAGAGDADQLSSSLTKVLGTVEVTDDLVRNALAYQIDPAKNQELVRSILTARDLFKEQLILQGLDSIVEFLDPYQYNENTSLAENIMFGASDRKEFSVTGLSENPVLLPLLQQYNLAQTIDETAIRAATTLVELFSDLPTGHDFFTRFGFLDADDLAQLERILTTVDDITAIDNLNTDDRTLLRSIPFRLISGRHRLGILTDDQKQSVVKIRSAFAKNLSTESRDKIDFFSPDQYNQFISISENIIFGRVVYGRLGAQEKVNKVLLDVLHRLDLMGPILEIGLAAAAGLAGSLLSMPQRQKLVLARGLLKQPKVLIVNDGLNAMDGDETATILSNIKQNHPDISLLWIDNQIRFNDLFDRYARIQSGILSIEEHLSSAHDTATAENSALIDLNKPSSRSTDEQERLNLLQNIPLFSMLDYHHLQLLASSCKFKNVPAGSRLFNQGDPGDAMYVVITGSASILIADDNSESKVREAGANEIIGELALISNNARSASVEAITDLKLLQLKREVFIDMLQSNAEIGFKILQVVTSRFMDSPQKHDVAVDKNNSYNF